MADTLVRPHAPVPPLLQSTVRSRQSSSNYSRWWWDRYRRTRGLLASAVSSLTGGNSTVPAIATAASSSAPAANQTAAGTAVAASKASAATASYGSRSRWSSGSWWRPQLRSCTRYLGMSTACGKAGTGLYVASTNGGAALVWELVPAGGTGAGQIASITLTAGNVINVFVRSAGSGAPPVAQAVAGGLRARVQAGACWASTMLLLPACPRCLQG